jgi:hypothetical protein
MLTANVSDKDFDTLDARQNFTVFPTSVKILERQSDHYSLTAQPPCSLLFLFLSLFWPASTPLHSLLPLLILRLHKLLLATMSSARGLLAALALPSSQPFSIPSLPCPNRCTPSQYYVVPSLATTYAIRPLRDLILSARL